MKKFLNFIISKIFKIPKLNLDTCYPPVNYEITSLYTETIRSEVMISNYIPEDVYKKELIHRLGESLANYIEFETIEDPYCPERFRCRATIRIVKER